MSTTSDAIKKYSTEIRLLKAALGIDKVTRDRTTGDDSVATRWADIQRRAKEFGVMRNEQFDMALELLNELIAMVILHDRCWAEGGEEKLMEVRPEDILAWIRDYATPKFRKIDADFRAGDGKYAGQKMWVEEINR